MPDQRLIIVSGPSGVGKGPIIDAVKKYCIPDLHQVKVRKSPTPRHTGLEQELGFEGMNQDAYQFDCRGSVQYLDVKELLDAFASSDKVLVEIYYKAFPVIQKIESNYNTMQKDGKTLAVIPVFISPLSLDEVNELNAEKRSLERVLPDIMLDALIRRALQESKAMTKDLVSNLESRAQDSLNELRFASNYKWIIANHCYESDPRWKTSAFFGEPRRVTEALADIINTGHSIKATPGRDFVY